MKYLFKSLLSIGMLLAASAIAAPADWYKWRSKTESIEICSQTSPGEGWTRAGGPFKNGQCEKLKQ